MGLSNLPENQLQQNEPRFGVYYLSHDGAAKALEVTVYKDGSVQIVDGLVQDKPLQLDPVQARQLATILHATPAGGPTMRGRDA